MSNLNDKEEMFTTVGVSKDIICKDCMFKDNKYDDYTRGVCEMYPDRKPSKVLWNEVVCEFYKKDRW